ncbi:MULTISPECIES: VOC family protein [Halomonadaceae]|jgi:catechol 2,3-dioxygenase-like lactoylglutathione lyase family enzyme|uniref:Glyoxalase n=1 Tax=Billgrantia aerodenitrificans TaxID=2733483 RepID=A0ABS9AQQ2_9GAMM|nr:MULTISPECIES: VOC family protein [Halomonas]MCE8023918.1 glyoxalase [Halomonas aerodenitrificans]MCE8036176.1 glyoxalase [Halomonas sp. MCCC 1A11062]
MSIVGIEALDFGVEDLEVGKRFVTDFGLSQVSDTAFETLNGARLNLAPIDDPALPPAFESGSTLRRMTWGAADSAALEALKTRLADQPGFVDRGDHIECQDPNGMTVAIRVDSLREVELDVTPINQYGDMRRVDQPSPVYERATPVGIGHAVFFVDDLEATEAFYRDRLGFAVSDRYTDRAVFLRMQARGGHHNLFLLKLPHRGAGLNHVAFTVRDIHEVIGGGLAMNRKQWSTFLGPGRHPISSAYFWYVNSPLGGAFEYYTNEDYLTEAWEPREMQHSLESFTEWAVEGGIDAETRRQKKAEA